MDRRMFLEGVVGGILGCEFFCKGVNGQEVSVENVQGLERKTNGMNQEDLLFFNVIRDIAIQDIVREHIEKNWDSEFFEKIYEELSNRFKGDKRKAYNSMVEGFSYSQEMCLMLALNPAQPSESDYEILGRKMITWEERVSRVSGYNEVDMWVPRVVSAATELGKIKVDEFRRLYNARENVGLEGDVQIKEIRENYVGNLYRSAFTRDEYLMQVNNQIRLNNDIAGGLKSTVRPLLKVKVSNDIDDMTESANGIIMRSVEKYFPSGKY